MMKFRDIGRRFLDCCGVPLTYSNLIAPGVREIVFDWVREQQAIDDETPSVLISTIPCCDFSDWDRRLDFYDDLQTKAAIVQISSRTTTNVVELPLSLFLNDEYREMWRRVLAGIPR